MGSNAVRVNVNDEHLHVGCDAQGLWWAVGREGSYGGGTVVRRDAINAALSAIATTRHAPRVVVHKRYGGVDFIINRTRRKPESQLFQDDVP